MSKQLIYKLILFVLAVTVIRCSNSSQSSSPNTPSFRVDSSLLHNEAFQLDKSLQIYVPAGWMAIPKSKLDSLNDDSSEVRPDVLGIWSDTLTSSNLFVYKLDSTLKLDPPPGKLLDSTHFSINNISLLQKVYRVNDRTLYRFRPQEETVQLDYLISPQYLDKSKVIRKLESSIGTISSFSP